LQELYWVFIKQWNTLQDTKSNRIDYFYERFKTNYILKKISLLIITLIAFSGASFSQNTFSLLITDLGGQATKTEEFSGFGREGENKSPQLSCENAPEGTKRFAITMYDPDAPAGSRWWHWVVFDIPANMNELVTNAGNINLNLVPKGVI